MMEDERGQVAHMCWVWWAHTRLWLNSHCHRCAIHTWKLVAATAAAAVRIAAADAIAIAAATSAKAHLQTHGRPSLSKLRRW